MEHLAEPESGEKTTTIGLSPGKEGRRYLCPAQSLKTCSVAEMSRHSHPWYNLQQLFPASGHHSLAWQVQEAHVSIPASAALTSPFGERPSPVA